MKQGSNYAFTAGKTDKERDAKRLASCGIVLFFFMSLSYFSWFCFCFTLRLSLPRCHRALNAISVGAVRAVYARGTGGTGGTGVWGAWSASGGPGAAHGSAMPKELQQLAQAWPDPQNKPSFNISSVYIYNDYNDLYNIFIQYI